MVVFNYRGKEYVFDVISIMYGKVEVVIRVFWFVVFVVMVKRLWCFLIKGDILFYELGFFNVIVGICSKDFFDFF